VVDDVYKFIEYLTIFDSNACQKKYEKVTWFPKGARLIATSNNIARAEFFDSELNEEQLQLLNEMYYEKHGRVAREDGHCYPSEEGGFEYCADWQYMRNVEEFIFNVVGTKEVNEKLKKTVEKSLQKQQQSACTMENQ